MIRDNCFCLPWDCNCIWGAITAIATLLVAVVGFYQLRALNNTNRATFLQNLKNDFFTDYERRLIFLLEDGFLLFRGISPNEATTSFEFYYFISAIPENAKLYIEDQVLATRQFYTTQEIDDYLLQHFEDLGLLYEKKIVSKYEIEQTFGYYLKLCWENEEIQKYIRYVQEATGDPDIYSKFKMICDELNY